MEGKDYFEYYGVPLELKKHISSYCLPSTTDALRAVSTPWLSIINKTKFNIITKNIADYSTIGKLARFTAPLSIIFVDQFRLTQLEPLIASVAELGTHIQALKLQKYVHYRDNEWVDFRPLKTLSNLTDANLRLCWGDLTFLKQFKKLKKLKLKELSSKCRVELVLRTTELEDLTITIDGQEYYLDQTGVLDSVLNPSRLTRLSLSMDITLDDIQQFSNLKELRLDRTGPYRKFQFPYLENLQIGYSEVDMAVIGRQSCLTRLFLEGVSSGLEDLQLTSQLTNLRVLILDYSPAVYGGSMEFVSKLTKLEALKIYEVEEEENGFYLQHLNCPNLTKLYAKLRKDRGYLQHLTRFSSSLQDLSLELDCEVQHTTILDAMTNLTNLLVKCRSNEVEQNHFCTKLKKLDVEVTTKPRHAVVDLKLPNLEDLTINWIEFSDSDAIYLSSTLQRLKIVLHPIAGSFAHLTRLTYLEAENIFPEDFANILQLVNLRWLVLHTEITQDQISQLTRLTTLKTRRLYQNEIYD